MIAVDSEVVMAKISKRVRTARWSEAEARGVLAEFARSGQSVAQFAEARGLDPERLYRWRKRVGGSPVRADGPRFAELTVRPAASSAAIEIELVGGVAVRIAGATRVEDAIAILTRLPVR